MDITPLYKACVKTLKTRNKALGLLDKDKQSLIIGRGPKVKTEFTVKVKDTLQTITKMRDFLLEHRKEYINSDFLLHGISHMTDSERDKIDCDAQAFIQKCVDIIKKLSNEVRGHADSQIKEHQEAIISLVDNYLKGVCKIYSGQKAIRLKMTVDKQKLLRLDDSLTRRTSFTESSDTDNLENSHSKRNSLVQSDTSSTLLNSSEIEPIEVDLSPEELQMFEEENQRLYEEMNTLVDEVREIEGKVVEIGKLQEILADKVLQQEHDINKIQDSVIGTTENIKEGNEDIREAIRNKAGFRVWILFILLVLSFSLLFLDWYSP